MLAYAGLALAVILGAHTAVRAAGGGPGVRLALVVVWMVAFPIGGWIVWRRSAPPAE